jgi:hypothetical protein
MRARNVAVVFRLHHPAVVGFDTAAFLDPGIADPRQTLLDIDFRRHVGVGS